MIAERRQALARSRLADDRQDLAAIEIEIEIRDRVKTAACGRKSDRQVADREESIHRGTLSQDRIA